MSREKLHSDQNSSARQSSSNFHPGIYWDSQQNIHQPLHHVTTYILGHSFKENQNKHEWETQIFCYVACITWRAEQWAFLLYTKNRHQLLLVWVWWASILVMAGLTKSTYIHSYKIMISRKWSTKLLKWNKLVQVYGEHLIETSKQHI